MTKTQVLDEFRRALGFSAAYPGCTVEAVDGIDPDSWLAQLADDWYTRLLKSADTRMIPTKDSSQSAVVSASRGGLVKVRRDPGRVRTLLVQMADWLRPVIPVPFEEAQEQLSRLASPFGAPGAGRPLAVELPDGSLLLGPDSQGGLTALMCVTDPRPTYTLHPALLATIKDYLADMNLLSCGC